MADDHVELTATRSGENGQVVRKASFNGSDCSQAEISQAIEVVLDDKERSRRRRDSLINEDGIQLVEERVRQRENTACHVHKLLAEERHQKHAKIARGVEISDDNRVDKSADMAEQDGHVRSRHLTKKQLSDMAWGVRELAKKLGGIRLKLKVRSVFLLTKAHDESLIAHTREIASWLLSSEREDKYIVYVEHTMKDNEIFNCKGLVESEPSAEQRLKYWTDELCSKHPEKFDFVVTLGGDGTVLYASHLFQRIVPPVLSFSLGSLGFLTKFDYENYQETLTTSFKEGVTVSLRLRFEVTVMRSQRRDMHDKLDLVEELIGEDFHDTHTHSPDGTIEILNDIVVDRGPNPTMSAIEIFGDDEHFTTVQADGVCVATPTGSTAYNLAAGGSLCHPENPVILVTAICAHTLSFRPIILPDTIVLRVGVPYDARTSSWASFDGRERVELNPGDYVTISASRFPFANVMMQGRRSEDWVNSLSAKLQWNSRQRQKAFKEWK